MKPPPTGEIELWPRDYPACGDNTPFGIIEILSTDDRHGCSDSFRRLIDTAIDAGTIEPIITRTVTDDSPTESSLEEVAGPRAIGAGKLDVVDLVDQRSSPRVLSRPGRPQVIQDLVQSTIGESPLHKRPSAKSPRLEEEDDTALCPHLIWEGALDPISCKDTCASADCGLRQ